MMMMILIFIPFSLSFSIILIFFFLIILSYNFTFATNFFCANSAEAMWWWCRCGSFLVRSQFGFGKFTAHKFVLVDFNFISVLSVFILINDYCYPMPIYLITVFVKVFVHTHTLTHTLTYITRKTQETFIE